MASAVFDSSSEATTLDDSFNPYEQWLGLPPEVAAMGQRPDHYTLLGLPQFEEDTAKIKVAADQATTRVRSFRPGDKARLWAQLLDELDEARKCLGDADARGRYDEQLKSGGNGQADGATPSSDADTAETDNDSPAQNPPRGNPAMYPPGAFAAPMPEQPRYGPAGPPPDDMQPTPTASPTPVGDPALFAPGHAQAEAVTESPSPQSAPATMPVSAPGRLPMGRSETVEAAPADGAVDPMAPMAMPSTAAPVSNGAGVSAQPSAEVDPMAPMAMPVGAAVDQSVQQPVMGATNSPIPLGTTEAAEPTTSPAIAKDEKPEPSSSKPLLLAGIVATVTLAIGVAGLLVYWSQQRGEEPSGPVVSAVDASDAGDDASDVPPPEEEPQPSPPHPEPEDPEPVDREPIVPVDPEPQPPITIDPPVVEPEPQPVDPPTPEPPVTIPTPDPDPPTPQPEPEPDPEPTPLTPAEKDALKKALVGARTAMGERDQASVVEQLATANQLARTDEHKAMVARLEELNHYVKEFWRSVDEAYSNLKPSTTIRIGNAEAAIVDVNENVLVLKYFGTNRTIAREDMPSGLAMAIANNWFTDDPANKVVKGALQLVDPNGRPEETRRLWQEAQAAGVDVEDLMPVMDDTYDF